MALPSGGNEYLVVTKPDLKYTQNGVAKVQMRVKASQRKKDDSGNWVDDKVFFATAIAWRETAEEIANTIVEKDIVVIAGRISTRDFEHEGVKRVAVELDIDSIGKSIKGQRSNGQQANQWQGQPQGQPQQGYAQPQQGYAQPQGGYVQQGAPQGQPQGGYAPQGAPQGQQGPWGGQPDPTVGQWGNGPQGEPPF